MQIYKLYENIKIINSFSKFDGEKRYIATWSLEWSKINFDSAEKITYNDRPSRASQQVDIGDLIFAKMQWTDKTLIIDETNKDYIYSSWFFVIRPYEGLDKNYLYQYLRSNSFHEQKDKLCTWATQKALTLDWLKKIEILLPSLSTQYAIAEKLDKVQSLIDLKKQVIAKTDDLAKAIFLEMFGDPMVNIKKREVKKFWEIMLEEPQNGLYKPSTDYTNNDNEWNPILRIDAFYDGKIINKKLKRLFCNDNEINKYKLHKDEIVINRVNSIEYLGKCALIEEGLDKNTVFESNMMRIKIDNNIANSIFITKLLCTPYAYNQILTRAKKAVNQASINQKDVLSLQILFPPLSLQQKFAGIITEIEAQKSDHKIALAKLEDLYQAEMQKSFSNPTRSDHPNDLP